MDENDDKTQNDDYEEEKRGWRLDNHVYDSKKSLWRGGKTNLAFISPSIWLEIKSQRDDVNSFNRHLNDVIVIDPESKGTLPFGLIGQWENTFFYYFTILNVWY